ncbi:GSCOCG00006027001-RA-CDS, partial [Cotesia congregata]
RSFIASKAYFEAVWPLRNIASLASSINFGSFFKIALLLLADLGFTTLGVIDIFVIFQLIKFNYYLLYSCK